MQIACGSDATLAGAGFQCIEQEELVASRQRRLLPEDAAVIVADAAAMPWPPAGKKK